MRWTGAGPAAPTRCSWKTYRPGSCPNPRSAAGKTRNSSTQSWPRRRSTGEPSRTCWRRSPGGRPMTSGSTPSTQRSPTSVPPPARQASPYARHARTWPPAGATQRHNHHSCASSTASPQVMITAHSGGYTRVLRPKASRNVTAPVSKLRGCPDGAVPWDPAGEMLRLGGVVRWPSG
jgi:hypothetical protein